MIKIYNKQNFACGGNYINLLRMIQACKITLTQSTNYQLLNADEKLSHEEQALLLLPFLLKSNRIIVQTLLNGKEETMLLGTTFGLGWETGTRNTT